jgi:two-component system, OmpR family, response regulator RegX3
VPKLLLVEDEKSIAEGLAITLEAEGFQVAWVKDGLDAIPAWERVRPDLVVLDLMLPGMSGTEICRTLRSRSDVPIIMLTAREAEVDRVVGLELGADDYVTKPFSTRELVARIKAILRRAPLVDASGEELPVESAGVRLDRARHEVRVDGQPVELPPKEFELLAYLLENAGRVLTRGQLIDEIWGSDYVGDTKTLDVHIRRLRTTRSRTTRRTRSASRRSAASGTGSRTREPDRRAGDRRPRPARRRLRTALDGALPWVWTLLVSISAVAIVQADVARGSASSPPGRAPGWSRGFHPLPVRGRGAWGQHAIVLNALGAAHERRGVKLSRERPWRRQLVDALVDPALLFSGEGRLLAANDAARELFGIPIDADDITVVQAVGSAALIGAVREVQATGHAVTVDTEHGDHDLRAVVSQVGDEALLLVNDRTRERRVEDLRRNFVVNASHELKTPVTASAPSPRRSPSRRRAPRNASRPAQAARPRIRPPRPSGLRPARPAPARGTRAARACPGRPRRARRRTVAAATEQADEREIELSVDAPDHAYVAGVPGDLEVIVKNLVGNAIQYNRAGGQVEVGAPAGERLAGRVGPRHRHRHPPAGPRARLRALLPRRHGS